MKKLLLAFLLLATSASAQGTLDVQSIYLGTYGGTICQFSSGSGAPSGGNVCDVYLDTATGNIYTKLSAGWEVLPRLSAANSFTGSIGVGIVPTGAAKLMVTGGVIVTDGMNVGDNVNAVTSGGLRFARASTSEPFLLFENASGVNALAQVRGLNGGGLRITNGTSATSWVDVISTGQVGIGTPTPAAKLAINGGLHVGGDSDPGDNNALIDGTLAVVGTATVSADVLASLGYVSNIGQLTKKFLTIHAAELWVETLVAQNTMATIGGRVLVAPTNILTADLASGATTMLVKYNNFANGDYAVMEASGSLEWIKISSAPSGSGPYTYTITRNQDGSGANNWVAGDALVNTGTTGSGYIDLYSVAGVLPGSTAGPTVVGTVRTGTASYANLAPRWAIGNLNGLYGYGATYGAAFGDPSGANLTIDATNGLRIRSTTTVYAQMAASVFTLGTPGGNRVAWDGTNLTVVSANLTIGSSGVRMTPAAVAGDPLTAYGFTVPSGELLGFFGIDSGGVRAAHVLAVQPSTSIAAQAFLGVGQAGYPGPLTGISVDLASGGAATITYGGSATFNQVLGTFQVEGAATLNGGLVSLVLPTDQGMTIAAGNNNNKTLNAGVSILATAPAGAGTGTLTGLTGGISGRLLVISNAGSANAFTITGEDANSTAANRFLPGIAVGGGESVLYIYYGNRWRLIK